MEKTLKMCPVCKQETDNAGFDCPHCNNKYALVTGFVSEAAYQTWLGVIANERRKRNSGVVNNFSKNQITVENGAVCIRGNGENYVTLCDGKGSVKRLDNVIQYSESSRHQVMLTDTGSLKVSGECDYDLSDLKDIKEVYAATGATYVVNNNGDVIVRGISPIQKQVSQWTNVKKLIGNRGRLVALTENGNVAIADDTIITTDNPIENDLRNLTVATKAVDVATTYNCTIWLNSDGTVGFNGRKSDPRSAVAKWSNIKAIAIENCYAVGLTTDGRVLLEGEAIAGLDLGRLEAKTWEDVIYIACSNSAILGVFMDGSVKIVGNMEKKDAVAKEAQQEIARFFN